MNSRLTPTPQKLTASTPSLFGRILIGLFLVGFFSALVQRVFFPETQSELTYQWAFIEKPLKKRDIHVESTDENGMTPFLKAAAQGDIKAMKMLKAQGANTQARAIYGLTALHFLAGNLRDPGHIVWLLEETPLHIDIRNNQGHTPFHIAVMMGNMESMQILKECGADLHAREHERNQAADLVRYIKDPEKKKAVEDWLRDNVPDESFWHRLWH